MATTKSKRCSDEGRGRIRNRMTRTKPAPEKETRWARFVLADISGWDMISPTAFEQRPGWEPPLTIRWFEPERMAWTDSIWHAKWMQRP